MLRLLILCLLNSASAFILTTPPATTALRSSARMQTLTPDAPTITKVPDALPISWEVPDTLPSRFSGVPPLFRLTLFDNGKSGASYIAASLLEAVPEMDNERASQIASKATSIGFALVGVFVEEVAEGAAEALRERDLVCDVSPEA